MQLTLETVSWDPPGYCGYVSCSECCSWSCCVSTSSSAQPWPAPSPALMWRWRLRRRPPVSTQSRTMILTGAGQAVSTAAGSVWIILVHDLWVQLTSVDHLDLITLGPGYWDHPAWPPTPVCRPPSQATQIPDQVHTTHNIIINIYKSEIRISLLSHTSRNQWICKIPDPGGNKSEARRYI